MDQTKKAAHESAIDEQRIREIVREELAEFKKTIQPTVVQLVVDQRQNINADAFTLERLKARLNASRIPEKPWG